MAGGGGGEGGGECGARVEVGRHTMRRITILGIIVLVIGVLMALGALIPPQDAVATSNADLTMRGIGVALIGILILMAAFARWYERR
jgi:hypothetical protein